MPVVETTPKMRSDIDHIRAHLTLPGGFCHADDQDLVEYALNRAKLHIQWETEKIERGLRRLGYMDRRV